MSYLLIFLDVSPGPVRSVGWGQLIVLLAVILALSVAVAGGLVFLLIWLKRRKQDSANL